MVVIFLASCNLDAHFRLIVYLDFIDLARYLDKCLQRDLAEVVGEEDRERVVMRLGERRALLP
jgi:hypothetical protein